MNFVFTFCPVGFIQFFNGPFEYKLFLNKPIWRLDETLIDMTDLGQSEPSTSEHYSMQFIIYPEQPIFGGGVLNHLRGYNQCILSPTNKSVWFGYPFLSQLHVRLF